mmetsp:Transcript_7670/g.12901  ORF Transcript_7670/g.12901 Transcript_7670/m.12901 type:complete len:122 (-) Transcript_7670:36-401(-)
MGWVLRDSHSTALNRREIRFIHGECPELKPFTITSWVEDFFGKKIIPKSTMCCVENCCNFHKEVPINVYLTTVNIDGIPYSRNQLLDGLYMTAPICKECYTLGSCELSIKTGYVLRVLEMQ